MSLDVECNLLDQVLRRSSLFSSGEYRAMQRILEYCRSSFSKPHRKVSIIRGRIRLRNDAGPTGELGEEEEFLRIDNAILRLANAQTIPPTLESQILIEEEREI